MTARRAVVPERCNIGPAEIDRRRWLAVALSVATVVLAIVIVGLGLPHVVRIVVWLPAAAAAVCWLQVTRRFCVRFGARGVENFGPLGREVAVDPAIRAADARRAAQLVLEGALAGLLATVALYYLPV